MRFALKMRLEVDEHTAAVLDGQSRIANWLYNHLLEEANALRQRYQETQDPDAARVLYTERGLRDRIPALKQEFPFLRAVHSSVLKSLRCPARAAWEAPWPFGPGGPGGSTV